MPYTITLHWGRSSIVGPSKCLMIFAPFCICNKPLQTVDSPPVVHHETVLIADLQQWVFLPFCHKCVLIASGVLSRVVIGY